MRRQMRKVFPMVLVICLGFAGGLLGQITANHFLGSYYLPDCFGSPHDEDIGFAYEGGIVKGYSDGSYNPTGVVTREQMATYIMRGYATSPAMSMFVVDFMYFDGYYFGADAYTNGRISYAQYEQNMKNIDWYFQLVEYQVSQGNDTRITTVGGETVMRILHDKLREQLQDVRTPAPSAPGSAGR